MDLDRQESFEDKPQGRVRRAAARCWAMLLARIYECLPLTCEKCGQPMRLIAFIMEPPVVQKILAHIGEPTVWLPFIPSDKIVAQLQPGLSKGCEILVSECECFDG